MLACTECVSYNVHVSYGETCAGYGSIPHICGEFGADNGCPSPNSVAIGVYVMVALALLYFVIICGFLLVKLRALNSLPYDRYQGAIVFYRLQVL